MQYLREYPERWMICGHKRGGVSILALMVVCRDKESLARYADGAINFTVHQIMTVTPIEEI